MHAGSILRVHLRDAGPAEYTISLEDGQCLMAERVELRPRPAEEPPPSMPPAPQPAAPAPAPMPTLDPAAPNLLSLAVGAPEPAPQQPAQKQPAPKQPAPKQPAQLLPNLPAPFRAASVGIGPLRENERNPQADKLQPLPGPVVLHEPTVALSGDELKELPGGKKRHRVAARLSVRQHLYAKDYSDRFGYTAADGAALPLPSGRRGAPPARETALEPSLNFVNSESARSNHGSNSTWCEAGR